MFEDYGALAPLREAAELLAAARVAAAVRRRPCSRANEVPVAAAIYADDLYVERALLGGDRRARSAACAPWVTNEYEHNGLRADGDRILGRLIDLARGRA